MARFKKGESGNPKGWAKGSRHKVTLAALALLEGDLEATLLRSALIRPRRETAGR